MPDDQTTSPRTALERDHRRVARLETMTIGGPQSMDARATTARSRLWSQRRELSHVRLRAGLVQHVAAGRSPLRGVSTPRGAGVQLLLMAIFEAQTRRSKVSAPRPTKVPVRYAEPGGTSWLQLLALPTRDQRPSRSVARTPEDNRYEQLRTALGHLQRNGRIRAGSTTGRNRFENFTLLDESELAGADGHETAYTWPRVDEPTIDVPVEFFVNGWVHALTDNEIITFLFVLAAHARARSQGEQDVALTAEDWAWAFGGDRGFESYRYLVRFGLLAVQRPAGRRADGTVEGGGAADAEFPYEAHRFRVLDDGLASRAVPAVIRGLRGRQDLDLDGASWIRLPPDGWTRAVKLAEMEAAALAAPPRSL